MGDRGWGLGCAAEQHSGAAEQAAAGGAVPFVLWFNFLSGFVYVLAGAGIAMGRRWAAGMAIALAAAIAAMFALFGLHVLQDGAFEMRTVGAMTLRLVVWIAVANPIYSPE